MITIQEVLGPKKHVKVGTFTNSKGEEFQLILRRAGATAPHLVNVVLRDAEGSDSYPTGYHVESPLAWALQRFENYVNTGAARKAQVRCLERFREPTPLAKEGGLLAQLRELCGMLRENPGAGDLFPDARTTLYGPLYARFHRGTIARNHHRIDALLKRMSEV